MDRKPDRTLGYVAEGYEYASNNVRGSLLGGMPGSFCSGSSNGNDPDSAILMCSIPYDDANAHVVNGRLLVYDPIHLTARQLTSAALGFRALGSKILLQQVRSAANRRGHIRVDVYRLKQCWMRGP